jgi:2-polyprenyl-3-methyl-5-hydroxy-6-metoxy-1,4-benzoquinol methylase
VNDAANRPFGKYERFGAYHWREVEPWPTRYNAVLAARYQVLLGAMDSNARRVLDIGCGDGTLTFRLARLGQHVWGIDDALLPLRLARKEFDRRGAKRPPVLASADARQLPFANEVFDCVVLADVIEHISAPDTVVGEAHRVLRSGGQILVTTPRREGTAAAHEYHCREYIASELAVLLGERFSAVQVRAFRPTRISRLYERRVFGRKLFRLAINCCAIAGWNPLAEAGPGDDERNYSDLCAAGRKS